MNKAKKNEKSLLSYQVKSRIYYIRTNIYWSCSVLMIWSFANNLGRKGVVMGSQKLSDSSTYFSYEKQASIMVQSSNTAVKNPIVVLSLLKWFHFSITKKIPISTRVVWKIRSYQSNKLIYVNRDFTILCKILILKYTNQASNVSLRKTAGLERKSSGQNTGNFLWNPCKWSRHFGIIDQKSEQNPKIPIFFVIISTKNF